MEFGFSLRAFKPSDLDRVIKINQRCLPENYSYFFYMDLYKKFPESFIVAEKNGEVVGYIMCRVERGLSNFRLLGITKKGHVVSIAILPEHQRQGIGSALMREVLKKMQRRATECYLEVRVTNKSAVNLYNNLGFKIVKKNQGYYADGEAAFTMAIKLSSTN